MGLITTSDFSGILVALAPSATPANNACGKDLVIQGLSYVSQATMANPLPAQNDPIPVMPKFPFVPKRLVGVAKTASQAWVAGGPIYLIQATQVYTTAGVSTGVVLAGIIADDAASADTVGNVIPAAPF